MAKWGISLAIEYCIAHPIMVAIQLYLWSVLTPFIFLFFSNFLSLHKRRLDYSVFRLVIHPLMLSSFVLPFFHPHRPEKDYEGAEDIELIQKGAPRTRRTYMR